MNVKDVRTFFENQKAQITEEEYKKIGEILQKLEKPTSNTLSEELKVKGNEAYGKGNFDMAIDFYTKSFEADESNYLALSNRALAYHKTNRSEEALKDCLKGMALEPSFIKFYIRAAMIYSETDKEKAVEYCEMGLKYEPENETLLQIIKENKPKVENSMGDLLKGFDPSKLGDIMKDENIKGMVGNLLKDKSPEELLKMMGDFLGKK